jgi:hypothetical protein
MGPEAAPPSAYSGALLSMNVWGATSPVVKDVQAGILDAWLSASPRPTLILLQEFKFSDKELVPICQGLQTASQATWKYVRQWSGPGQRDTVVLVNTAEFDYERISLDKYMKKASSEYEINRRLGKGLDKEKITSYETRWAGVKLAPYDNTTANNGVSKKHSQVRFLLVSYHGREQREQAEGSKIKKKEAKSKKGKTTDVKGKEEAPPSSLKTKLQQETKALLARDFVSEVALQAMHSTYAVNDPNGKGFKCIPALIAGDWNVDIRACDKFKDYPTDLYKCTPDPPPFPPPRHSVRWTFDGSEVKPVIDYVVSVNHKEDHEMSCDIKVTNVQALEHKAKYRVSEERETHVFDHDPLLVRFCITPRYPQGIRAARVLLDERPPQRLAAQIATETIRRLSGREMREKARKRPVSVKLDFLKNFLDGDEDEQPSPAEENKAEVRMAAEEPQPPPPPPLPTAMKTGERTILLARHPKSYDLMKSAKEYTQPQFKAAVKAMALDALGVENIRGKKINKEDRALEQPWWPKNVTKLATTEFDNLTDKRRSKLYSELQVLLLAKGIGAENVVQGGVLAENVRATSEREEEAPAVQSNILTAKGLSRFVRKNLNRLVSREQAREP